MILYVDDNEIKTGASHGRRVGLIFSIRWFRLDLVTMFALDM